MHTEQYCKIYNKKTGKVKKVKGFKITAYTGFTKDHLLDLTQPRTYKMNKKDYTLGRVSTSTKSVELILKGNFEDAQTTLSVG